MFYKNLMSDAEQFNIEIKRLKAKKNMTEKRAESIKKYLSDMLNGDKIKTPRAEIKYVKAHKVQITDYNRIPLQYLRYLPPEVNKEEIKKAINKGKTVDGAILEHYTTMNIK